MSLSYDEYVRLSFLGLDCIANVAIPPRRRQLTLVACGAVKLIFHDGSIQVSTFNRRYSSSRKPYALL